MSEIGQVAFVALYTIVCLHPFILLWLDGRRERDRTPPIQPDGFGTAKRGDD